MSRSYSGKQIVRVLRRIGYVVDHQRGSHALLHNLDKNISVIVPMHKEIKKGTLHNILKKDGISQKKLQDLL